MRLGRSILVVVLAALAISAAVTVWQLRQQPLYESTAVAVVEASPSTLAAAGARPENIVFLARTFAARIEAPSVLEAAVEQGPLDLDVEEAQRHTTVNVSAQDATITIRGTQEGPEAAQLLAQTVVETVVELVAAEQQAQREARLAPLDAEIAEVETSLAQLEPGSPQLRAAEQQYQALVVARTEAELEPYDQLHVLSPATAPTAPISPRPLRAGVLAFLIGAAIAAQILVTIRLLRNDRQDRLGGSDSARASS